MTIQNGNRRETVTYMELIARVLVKEAIKDPKAAKFLCSITDNLAVPMPSDRGMIFFNPERLKGLDFIEHACEVWGEERKLANKLAGGSAGGPTSQSEPT